MANLVKRESPVGELTLRDGELRSGALRLVRKTVKLQAGVHYTAIGGNLMLSPQGADVLNSIAALSVFFPDLEKQRRADVRDDSGAFIEVTRRVVVAGRTPLGAMQAIDYSCTFNVQAYFKKDLLKKVSEAKAAGGIGTKDNPPPDDGRWVFVPIRNDVGIWADLNHPEVVKAYSTYVQNQMFADRRCLGTARRNALCMHGAFPPKILAKTDGKPASFDADVYYHKPDSDFDRQTMIGMAEEFSARGTAFPQISESDTIQADFEDLGPEDFDDGDPEEAPDVPAGVASEETQGEEDFGKLFK